MSEIAPTLPLPATPTLYIAGPELLEMARTGRVAIMIPNGPMVPVILVEKGEVFR